jgi:hypothetical protein
MNRTIVIYCAHGIGKTLKFFLNHGLIKNDPSVDFYICFNNDEDIGIDKMREKASNITNLFLIQRPNLGLDFGAWIDILYREKDKKHIWELYDYYILLNDSCIGPFTTVYEKRKWTNIFTEMITDKIKLVGPTINPYSGRPHVQTYMWCFDQVLFRKLKEIEFLIPDHPYKNITYEEKFTLINHFEIGISCKTIELGYHIKSLLKDSEIIDYSKYYGNRNFVFPSYWSQPYEQDHLYNMNYCGMNIHPYEVIFFKYNRGISPDVIEKYILFHNANITQDIAAYIFA